MWHDISQQTIKNIIGIYWTFIRMCLCSQMNNIHVPVLFEQMFSLFWSKVYANFRMKTLLKYIWQFQHLMNFDASFDDGGGDDDGDGRSWLWWWRWQWQWFLSPLKLNDFTYNMKALKGHANESNWILETMWMYYYIYSLLTNHEI